VAPDLQFQQRRAPVRKVYIGGVNDPLFQTAIVAVAINLAAAGITFYLWRDHREERFLQFWAIAWSAGLARWLIHLPASSNAILRDAEFVLISVTMLFMAMGSYALLPNPPWPRSSMLAVTATLFAAFDAIALGIGSPLGMGYGLFATVIGLSAACMWITYRATRLSGYAFVAGTLAYQLIVVTTLLVRSGGEVAESFVVPLYNIPLMLSIVVIAHQRDRHRLVEAEQTTRRLYVRLANAEVDERRALHAELHDRVGANLAALGLELDVAARLLPGGEADARAHVASARDVTAEIMVMTRDLMADLRPPGLDDAGLLAALREFAQVQSSRFGIPITVVGDDSPSRRDPMVESALFRIAQEATLNAARHAAPTLITLTVEDANGGVLLSIDDDGAGFDPAIPRPNHWGLASMRERARAIGGALTIRTGLGAGTRVTAVAPGRPA
jgi:signal transduction histidine kinase